MTDLEILEKYGEPGSGYASHREWIDRCQRIERWLYCVVDFLKVETPDTKSPSDPI